MTAWSERYAQAYSSRHGARSQALTVFVRGTGTDVHAAPRVLEVGFGLGHNFRASLASRDADAPIDYLAYEFDPAPPAALAAVSDSRDPLWEAVLNAWGNPVRVHDGHRRVEIRLDDVITADLPHEWATAVYLDGFSPAVNPDVWTEALLCRLAEAMRSGGVLATYSAAGSVRRALQSAGLTVEKRRGLAGKREFLVAVKP